LIVQQKWWGILFGAVMAACAALFVISPMVGWWLPKNVSTFGGEVDGLFYLILGITGFFFILTEAILVYNLCKFSHRPAGEKAQYVHGNHKLEVFWTAIPAAILLLIAFLQINTWEKIKYRSRMPEPNQVFEVSARQFEWRVRYPTMENMEGMASEWKSKQGEPESAKSWSKEPHLDDIHVVNEIHTWKGANVRLYLTTKDVLHSFYLPNLRLKQDAVPGKMIPVWFNVTESNWDESKNAWRTEPDYQWDLVCAELCGWGHYKMIGRLYVHKDKADYERWLQEAKEAQDKTKP
jgi:cytochrome c oxidase subunit 2